MWAISFQAERNFWKWHRGKFTTRLVYIFFCAPKCLVVKMSSTRKRVWNRDWCVHVYDFIQKCVHYQIKPSNLMNCGQIYEHVDPALIIITEPRASSPMWLAMRSRYNIGFLTRWFFSFPEMFVLDQENRPGQPVHLVGESVSYI